MIQQGLLTDDLFQVVELGAADDGCGDRRLGERPRSRDLRHLEALLLRELLDAAQRRVSFLVGS